MSLLIQHIPHAIPVVLIWGILVRFWLAQRRLERAEGPPEVRVAAPAAPAAAAPTPRVRRSVAIRGLLALGPVLGALATGLVIYALNLGRGQAGQAAIWTHVGISLLALLLVAYKIADIGLARLRESVSRRQAAWSAGSIVLLALWVPLLASGVALLIFPSESSFTAYAHLIASVWWTGLLLWHLRRYLVRATRAVLARPATPGAAPSTRSPTPGSPPADSETAARAGAENGRVGADPRPPQLVSATAKPPLVGGRTSGLQAPGLARVPVPVQESASWRSRRRARRIQTKGGSR